MHTDAIEVIVDRQLDNAAEIINAGAERLFSEHLTLLQIKVIVRDIVRESMLASYRRYPHLSYRERATEIL
jgi:hypothetical protein